MSEAAERRARRRMYRTGAGFARNEYLAPTGGDRRRPPPGRHARPGRLRQHDRHRADDRDDQTPAEPGEPVTRPPSRPVPSRPVLGSAPLPLSGRREFGPAPSTVGHRLPRLLAVPVDHYFPSAVLAFDLFHRVSRAPATGRRPEKPVRTTTPYVLNLHTASDGRSSRVVAVRSATPRHDSGH